MTGSWVYDDFNMLGNELYDDVADIGAVWGNTSSDYMTPEDEGLESGYTWRPLTMLTLISVHALTDENAFAHHVTSWLLHGVVLGLLLLAASRARGTPEVITLAAVSVFALHPALGEAWLWINGRSDLVCAIGVALAGLAVTPHRDGRPPGRWAWALFGVGAFMGALGKEVALPAVGAIAVACALPAKVHLGRLAREPRRAAGLVVAALRRAAPLLLVLVAVFFAWRTGRLTAGGDVGSFAGIALGDVIARTPLALALAGETVVAPVPRPMRTLAWEFFVGWTASRAVVFATMVAILSATVWFGRLRSTVLLLGAAAAIAPVTLVVDFDWHGLDRYLYIPMILASLAAFWDAPRVEFDRVTGLWRGVAGLILAVFAVALVMQAQIYSSHSAWVRAMITLQPENPSGHVKSAYWLASQGDFESARITLEDLIDVDMPAATRHAAGQVALRVERPDIAAAHVEAAYRDNPDHPMVLLDLLMLRHWQNQWDDVPDLARDLTNRPLTCDRTLVSVQSWLDLGIVPETVAGDLESLATNTECP